MPKPELLVVDAANVIGSRPDGWWRDRPAAVQRLITALARGPGGGEDVTVVLEGAARAGAEPGIVDGIQVVHARGSADDEIVRIVAAAAAEKDRPIAVATADRQLRERVTALGARVVGPRSLWERLDAGS